MGLRQNFRYAASVSGTIVPGHQVASGGNHNPAYPGGTLRMQAPHFADHGLDLSAYHAGTLNLSIAPWELELRQPRWTFRKVRWHPVDPAEDFSFVDCRIFPLDSSEIGPWQGLAALVYFPHPETKPTHHQPKGLVEILAPFLPGVTYGSKLQLEVPPEQAAFQTRTPH